MCSSNEVCLSIQVYTSGKGSSAAGLTASVMRDPVSVSLYHNVRIHGYLIPRMSAEELHHGRWGYGAGRWGCGLHR